MKQIVQSYKDGKIELADLPCPRCPEQAVLVQNLYSVISLGTEKSMIELGRKSLLGKARSRPDLVRRVIEKAKNEGLVKTFQAAQRRLNEAMPLGYSSAGIVAEAGAGISNLRPGEMVACMGGGYASHAEYVTVPENLCVRIPEGVLPEEASFGMLGIIAMHALRCADLQPGERVAVMGLGLLGLILVQLLEAYGLQVIATDLDEGRRKLAVNLGVKRCPAPEAFVSGCEQFTNGSGVDAVILAVATTSDQPIHEAIQVSRFRGKIVLMGVADTHPHRNDLWEKEVSLVVSKAGGPGIGDPIYEVLGVDYPLAHVRWTENRNLEEFLRLLAENRIQLKPLITHTFDFSNALEAYESLLSGKLSPAPIGVLLRYEQQQAMKRQTILNAQIVRPVRGADKVRLGLIGGGLFAKTTMLPALNQATDISLKEICTSRGLTGNHIGRQYGFERCGTDADDVLNAADIDAVMILTQHKDHAGFVNKALQSGKQVFVEKPLCVTHEQLDEVIGTYAGLKNKPLLFVGYNRRFSCLAGKLKAHFIDRTAPLVMQYRVNAGFLEPDHWIFSPENGHGRIIGEACHMVDFMIYLIGSQPVRVSAERIGANGGYIVANDNVLITIRFEDGSIGSIVYTGSGDRLLPRERFEVFGEGKSAVLNDFRELVLYKKGRKKRHKLRNADMGYKEEVNHFAELAKGSVKAKLTPEEIFYSTRVVLCAHDSLETGKMIDVNLYPSTETNEPDIIAGLRV